MHMLQFAVETQFRNGDAAREEGCSSTQLGMAGAQPWRETTSAPQALAKRRLSSSGCAAQPAAQQPRHERVARAEHVEHLDREACGSHAVLDAPRDLAGEGDAARPRRASVR